MICIYGDGAAVGQPARWNPPLPKGRCANAVSG